MADSQYADADRTFLGRCVVGADGVLVRGLSGTRPAGVDKPAGYKNSINA